jgi:hypothetical protein
MLTPSAGSASREKVGPIQAVDEAVVFAEGAALDEAKAEPLVEAV